MHESLNLRGKYPGAESSEARAQRQGVVCQPLFGERLGGRESVGFFRRGGASVR